MNNLQSTLLFPVRDAESRKQFLITAAVMMAGMIIPILPLLVVMGYGAKIMRQVIDEGREPSMPTWQSSELGELLKEGLRLWAVRMVYALPFLLIMGCAFSFMGAGTGLLASSDSDALPVLGGASMIVGLGLFLLIMILAIPLAIVMGAAEAHAVTKQSFQASLQIKEWAPILRKGLSAFLLAYAVMMAASFILTFALQIAMITVILLCILPFLTMGLSAYLSLITNVLFAQAYVTGRAALQAEEHASA